MPHRGLGAQGPPIHSACAVAARPRLLPQLASTCRARQTQNGLPVLCSPTSLWAFLTQHQPVSAQHGAAGSPAFRHRRSIFPPRPTTVPHQWLPSGNTVYNGYWRLQNPRCYSSASRTQATAVGDSRRRKEEILTRESTEVGPPPPTICSIP